MAELADVIGGVSEKRRAEIAHRSRASSSNVKKSSYFLRISPNGMPVTLRKSGQR